MVKLSKHDQEQLEKAKDLLEAGPLNDMGFARSLFFGRLRTSKILPYPVQDPDEARRTDELIEKVERFMAEHIDPDRIDTEERIAPEVIRGLGDLGVLGLTVPREYGGQGLSHTAYCRVLERVARRCASTAVLVGAHQSIGLKALMLNGTEEQKRKYLPDLAAGRKLAAFCLSEPEVGSDAANVQTTARQSEDGQHWIINGQKKFATNAALAGFMTVMARTPVEDNGKIKDKVTAFIVTPDLPGFEVVSPNRSKMGIRGTWQATLKFTDMRVPKDQVLGELGRGLRVALTVLDFGRCTLSAGAVGGAKVAYEMAVDKARTRRQFNRAIGEFHLVKKLIARMAEDVFAMDALTYWAAGMVDRHEEDLMLETAITKLFCTERSWQVVDDALQIWGGEGYMREHGIERMLRDARINRIVEGATEVMTAFVALTGMKGVGEDLEAVMKAARHPIDNFGRLAEFVQREFRDVVVGHSIDGLHPQLAGEGRMLAKLTRRLAREIGRLLARHRQHIIDRQLLQERIAWSVVEMCAMAAVIGKLQSLLDHAKGNGDMPDLKRDLIVGKGFCRHAAERIRHRLDGLRRNTDRDTLAVADAVLDLPKPGNGKHA